MYKFSVSSLEKYDWYLMTYLKKGWIVLKWACITIISALRSNSNIRLKIKCYEKGFVKNNFVIKDLTATYGAGGCTSRVLFISFVATLLHGAFPVSFEQLSYVIQYIQWSDTTEWRHVWGIYNSIVHTTSFHVMDCTWNIVQKWCEKLGLKVKLKIKRKGEIKNWRI